ncbi:glycoside hydrolase family 16 protein [Sphingomonas rubra]|uniref:Glycosyl hydrolases family 16 n=1 Tax=Sphingomonas rubra TaxID=634430 RepID=A0A1I5UPS0_9SPHN|nr:glycoside hydrolase family 16 protein [Sphingomonas rubra]SFP97294.1 Glycosyl hydrolases family 16 [Sphingomonas rubra]
MIALLLIAQAATLGATDHAADGPMSTPTARPTFSDEFAGRTVDTTRWRYDVDRNPTGWPNHERQYYAADRRENARIERGALVIEARAETLSKARFPDWGGQAYSSAKLVSRGAFGTGFYEVRARLPCGRGAWPAIWLLPSGGTWPDEGEIDIMEMVGWDPTVIHATLHSAAFNHTKGTQRGAQRTVPTACTAFHRYQLDWRADAITIGIDGRQVMRVANDQPCGKAAWPFTRPYHLILNLAVGGDWGGQKGLDDRAFPQEMAIDYVRYWKR